MSVNQLHSHLVSQRRSAILVRVVALLTLMLSIAISGCETPVEPVKSVHMDSLSAYFWPASAGTLTYQTTQGLSLPFRVTSSAGSVTVADVYGVKAPTTFSTTGGQIVAQHIDEASLFLLPKNHYFSRVDQPVPPAPYNPHVLSAAITDIGFAKRIFIGLDLGGVAEFDPSSKTTRMIGLDTLRDIVKLVSSPSSDLWVLSQSNQLFFGTDPGTGYIWEEVPTDFLAGQQVVAMTVDNLGFPVIATANTVFAFNGTFWGDLNTKLFAGGGKGPITAIHLDQNPFGINTLFVATDKGVIAMDLSTGASAFFPLSIGSSDRIVAMESDTRSNVIAFGQKRFWHRRGNNPWTQLTYPSNIASSGVATAAIDNGMNQDHFIVADNSGNLHSFDAGPGDKWDDSVFSDVLATVKPVGVQIASMLISRGTVMIVSASPTFTNGIYIDVRPGGLGAQASLVTPKQLKNIRFPGDLTLLKSDIAEGMSWKAGTMIDESGAAASATSYTATVIHHFDEIAVPVATDSIGMHFTNVFVIQYKPDASVAPGLPVWTIFYARNRGPVAIEQTIDDVLIERLVLQ